jgi:predicted ATPase/DNA-binding SARP family transcriptional activator
MHAGVPIPLSGLKRKSVLVALALSHGRVVSADRLIDLVWGDDVPPGVSNTLQSHVSYLRKVLGADARLLVSRPPGYVLDAPDDAIDLASFRRSAELGRRCVASGLAEEATERFAHALALWRGRPFADLEGVDFAEREAARLEEERLGVLEERYDAELTIGRHQDIVDELEVVASDHPLRERLAGALILALYRGGRQAEALRAYDRTRVQLAEELGIDPSRVLKELHDSILFQRASLDFVQVPDAVHRAEDTDSIDRPRAHRDELPLEATPLVGRDDLVAHVAALLEQHRLVTLWGPGGVGKSRVALRVARVAQTSFDDGVCFVDLSVVEAGGGVAGLVVAALRAQPLTDESATDTVIRVLRPARLLLVLDTCEHVLDDARSLASAVLDQCPWVTIVATSRETLALAWDQSVAVPPLDIPRTPPSRAVDLINTAGAELFLQRARAVDPSFNIDDANAVAVSTICREVDGLPLALELVAGRIDVESLDEIAAATSDLRLVQLESRWHGDARLSSVTGSVRWSFNLLTPAEQAAFLRLTVFVGPFTRDMATTLMGDTDERQPVFDRLVRSAMVARDHLVPSRFRLLGPLKEFGRSLVSSIESEKLSEQHAQLMLERAIRIGPLVRTSEEAHALSALRADFADMRAAMTWLMRHGHNDLAARLLVEIYQFCHFQLLAEAYTWAMRLAALLTDDDELAAEVCGAAALGAWFEGDLETAVALGERSVGIAAAARRPAPFWARLALIDALAYEGEFGKLALNFRAFVEETRLSDESFWRITGLGYESISARMFTRPDVALRRAEEAVAEARRLGNPDCLHWALHCLGTALTATEPHAACRAFEEAIATTRRIDSRWNLILDLLEWIGIKRALGDVHEAAEGLLELLNLLGSSGNRSHLAGAFREAAGVLEAAGDFENAAMMVCASAGLPAIQGDAPHEPTPLADLVPDGVRTALGPRLAEILVSGRMSSEHDSIVLCRTRLELLVARVATTDSERQYAPHDAPAR